MNHTKVDERAFSALETGAQPDSGPIAGTRATVWDSILVGSSPLLLLEATYLGRIGRRVLVLEEKGQLGGAWGHLDSTDIACLDIGCHYIDISKRTYEFLHTNFGLNLVPTRPQPQFVYRNFRFPYDYRQVIRVARYLKAALKQRSIAPFVSRYWQDENYRLRIFPFTKKFLYPRGGSFELTTKLVDQARQNNVTILDRRCIESIHFDSKRQRVKVRAVGETFEAGEIVAGSQARIADALQVTAGEGPPLRQVFTHVNLVLRDPGKPSFSYVRFLRHPAVIRMTDISNYVRPQNESLSGFRVICIGIRESYDRTEDDADKVEQLCAMLRKYRFVDPAASCEGAFWSRYPAEFFPDQTRQKILHEFSPMIRFMPTTNLSVGIVTHLDRWQPAYASNRLRDDTCQTTRD